MIRVLVPIGAFSQLTISATYFALEFAKRNPAKIFFLVLEKPGKKSSTREQAIQGKQWPDLFNQLLQRGREQQVNLEIHHSQEDYFTAISQLAEQQNIDDIIIAVPPVTDQTNTRVQRFIELLRHQVRCNIIKVKEKEVGKMLDSLGRKEN
jgi:hypothetical protein